MLETLLGGMHDGMTSLASIQSPGLSHGVQAVLAYRPFLDPLDLHGVWYLLLIPLSLLTAMAYKAVRVPTMRLYWRQTFFFFLQILLGITGLYVASVLVVKFAMPALL